VALISEPIFWSGRQWLVTSYGVERADGLFSIDAGGLFDGWLFECGLIGAEWVDVSDFIEALRVAVEHFAPAQAAAPPLAKHEGCSQGQKPKLAKTAPRIPRSRKKRPKWSPRQYCAAAAE
jgi:hypothetical protein